MVVCDDSLLKTEDESKIIDVVENCDVVSDS